MKNTRKLLIGLAISLVMVLAPASWAAEGCSDAGEMEQLCKMLKEWATKTIGDASFVKTCMGFSEDPEVCDAADAPGTGLVCPGPGAVTTNPHSCQIFESSGFAASFGTKAGQVIKIAGEFSVHFVMIGEEKSIPSHNHQQTCDGSGSCAEEYVKRQEKVTVFFAAAQEGKISVDPIESFTELDTFKAGLDAKKVTFFQVTNHHYCSKVDHGDPRSCRKGPTTPGGGGGGGSGGGCTGDTCEVEADVCTPDRDDEDVRPVEH